MKKYLLFLFIISTSVANAAQMCVKDDTLLVVLDPVISPTSTSFNEDNHSWSATFSYGTISGVAGCGNYRTLGQLSGTGIGDVKPSVNQSAVELVGTDINMYICACKMLMPVESLWINAYYQQDSATAACSTLCAEKCATRVNESPTVRANIFGNVIQ